MFLVGEQTGALEVGGRLDRDTDDCRTKDVCVRQLLVAVQLTPSAGISIIKVNVEVLDQNDNSPSFTQSQKRLTILESATIGTHLSLPQATDLDGPEFTVKRYELVPKEDNIFQLQVSDARFY